MDVEMKPIRRTWIWKERKFECDNKCKVNEGTTYILYKQTFKIQIPKLNPISSWIYTYLS